MKKKIRVRVMAFILVLVMGIVAVPEKAGAMTMATPYGERWEITKGYNLPVKVMPKQVGAGGQVVFHPSKKDYLNRNNHIMPGCMCGTDSDKSYKAFNKKVLENPKNDKYCVVWPETKDYKGGIPKRAKYLAELTGKKCWYYPGGADELELFAPDELEKKVIEILESRGFVYLPHALQKQYEMGKMTKKEYEKALREKGDGSWTEIAYPANLKSNQRPAVGSSWLSDKNRHSVDAYAKDLADAIEKHELNGYKNLEAYKDNWRKLSGEDEEWEGQYAPWFDLNYCGIESCINGFSRRKVGDKWITKYTYLQLDYVWKIY